MDQRHIRVSPEAIDELRRLLFASQNLGAESFAKQFRAFCERHDWAWFGLQPKRLFNFNAMELFAAFVHGCYSDERLRQLRGGSFQSWVYRASGCEARHEELDGLVLPPDHEFWLYYYPPLGWRCGCYVAGARSKGGCERLGGNPAKRLPEWWNSIDPATELPPGIEEPWGSQQAPDLLLLLGAMADGHSPKPEFG